MRDHPHHFISLWACYHKPGLTDSWNNLINHTNQPLIRVQILARAFPDGSGVEVNQIAISDWMFPPSSAWPFPFFTLHSVAHTGCKGHLAMSLAFRAQLRSSSHSLSVALSLQPSPNTHTLFLSALLIDWWLCSICPVPRSQLPAPASGKDLWLWASLHFFISSSHPSLAPALCSGRSVCLKAWR